MNQTEFASACIGTGCASIFASLLGLPEIWLIPALVGALLSLAFIKPVHWGTWLDIPPTTKTSVTVFYWLRRVIIVAFILSAVAILAAALVTAIQETAPAKDGLLYLVQHIDPRVTALMFGAAGQAFIPLGLKWVRNKEAAA